VEASMLSEQPWLTDESLVIWSDISLLKTNCVLQKVTWNSTIGKYAEQSKLNLEISSVVSFEIKLFQRIRTRLELYHTLWKVIPVESVWTCFFRSRELVSSVHTSQRRPPRLWQYSYCFARWSWSGLAWNKSCPTVVEFIIKYSFPNILSI
jgi:hypothetical protein